MSGWPGTEKRTVFGRLLRFFLDPTYYWLDLKGLDGRPSYSKIFGAASFGFGLVLLFRLWGHWFDRAKNGGHPEHWELAFLLAFSFMVFVLPYGIRGLNLWAMSRGVDLLTPPAARLSPATMEPARVAHPLMQRPRRPADAEPEHMGDP